MQGVDSQSLPRTELRDTAGLALLTVFVAGMVIWPLAWLPMVVRQRRETA
jgi:hypothetical protein